MKKISENQWSELKDIKQFINQLQTILSKQKEEFQPEESFPLGSLPFGIFAPVENYLSSINRERQQNDIELEQVDSQMEKIDLEIQKLAQQKERLAAQKQTLLTNKQRLNEFLPLCEEKSFQ